MRKTVYADYADAVETLSLDQLIWIAGIGNLIGAGIDHLPEDFLKKVVYMDLVKIHNTARSSSRIRRMAREELLGRDYSSSGWHRLYMDAKSGTLLEKRAAAMMLEISENHFERRIAYEAIHAVAPDLRSWAAERVVDQTNEPHMLRYISTQKKYPDLAHLAQTKLHKMFTL